MAPQISVEFIRIANASSCHQSNANVPHIMLFVINLKVHASTAAQRSHMYVCQISKQPCHTPVFWKAQILTA
jgi:hypothetical protein